MTIVNRFELSFGIKNVDVTLGRYAKRGVLRDEWGGTQAELEELADIKELAVLEWRDELFRMLKRPPIGLRCL